MSERDVRDRAALIAAQEAIKSSERLFKTDISQKELLPKKPKIVAIDLDGTILHNIQDCQSKQFGKPIPGIKDKIRKLKALGWCIVIWTVREESPELIAHLNKHEIIFDYINWHPWQPKGTSVKLLADVYIDDRAVSFTGEPLDFDQILVFKPWWKK